MSGQRQALHIEESDLVHTIIGTVPMKTTTGISSPSLFLAVLFLVAALPSRTLCQSKPGISEKLVAQAEVIAIGKVASLSSEWNEAHSRIRTRVTLSVSEFVKGGSPGGSMTIYVPGGEVDGIGEIYSHMPTFHQDENVVVFAAKDRENHLRVSEGARGKFTIEQNTLSGRPEIAGGISVDQFKTQIRLAIQKQQETK